jgi:hypothetical protein
MTHLSCQDLIDIAAVKVRLETPQEIRHQIWKELGRATHDRHHAWRTPVLATVSSEGDANARTVVLRSVDSQLNQLQIYTDSRSFKAVELTANPSALFVFWSPRLSWQLRVRTTVTLVKSGDQVEQLWSQVQHTGSAADYLSPSAPGSLIPSDVESSFSCQHQTINFAVLNAQVDEMDWLELARSGHRRARLTHDRWEWLVP